MIHQLRHLDRHACANLQNAAGIFYALAYLAMFAVPLIGRQKEIARPALWLKAAPISGFTWRTNLPPDHITNQIPT